MKEGKQGASDEARRLGPAVAVVDPDVRARRGRQDLSLIFQRGIRLHGRDRVIPRSMRLQIDVPRQLVAAAPAEAPLQAPVARSGHLKAPVFPTRATIFLGGVLDPGAQMIWVRWESEAANGKRVEEREREKTLPELGLGISKTGCRGNCASKDEEEEEERTGELSKA